MASTLVGTTATTLPRGGRGFLIIQNLGPGVIYIDVDETATTSGGLQIPVDAVYEFPSNAGAEVEVSVISTEASTDVRTLIVGQD